jgi:NAD(P)-dependent dehydrogenase (short-subunit alcohol dehydrogenase family)
MTSPRSLVSDDRPVAIVAGVGPGIGRSTALGLARQGYDVAVAARRIEYLNWVSSARAGWLCRPTWARWRRAVRWRSR